MEAASNIVELSQIAAGEIRRLSGFNRVMVYRFDEEWNGEVIADDVIASPISYLGLRFPASDIPPQVRQLFLINPLRMIADVDATPVGIVSANEPLTGRPLDLSHSVTRWPAPVHLEYLRNMGVQASLTISIIVERRPWGLITCHHREPRRLDRSTRSVCELIGEAFASQVNLRIDNEALQARLTSRKMLETCMAEIGRPNRYSLRGISRVRHCLICWMQTESSQTLTVFCRTKASPWKRICCFLSSASYAIFRCVVFHPPIN
jgi:light-regulated signal transduction histidine kinase (bacteriophytochrome)